MKRILIVFAKEPEMGKVKTRLGTCFSESQLLKLYKAFLKDTLDIAKKVRCEEKILAFSSTKEPQYLKKVAAGFKFYRQKGRNLGDRMHDAFVYAQKNDSNKTVIIGSDSPALPFGTLQKAFQKLDRCDLVLGPSADGGYYLIGLREPCFGLFKGVKWSSSRVLRDTLRRAEKFGKKVWLLERWYDIDEPDALARLKRYLEKKENRGVARATKKFLDSVPKMGSKKGGFRMFNQRLLKTTFVMVIVLIFAISFLTRPAYAQGKGKGQKETPPGWEKGEKKEWSSDVPPGLAKKEGWIPPGWSKGEKEGWKDSFPPGWEKRNKREQTVWKKNLKAAKDSIKKKGKELGFSEEEIEQASTSLEITSRIGVPIEDAEDVVNAAMNRGQRGPAIEKLTRAVSYGVGREVKFDQLGKFVNEKLDAGLRDEELALEVYKEVQRRHEEKTKARKVIQEEKKKKRGK